MNKPVCIIDLGHAANSKVCCRIKHKDSDIMMHYAGIESLIYAKRNLSDRKYGASYS